MLNDVQADGSSMDVHINVGRGGEHQQQHPGGQATSQVHRTARQTEAATSAAAQSRLEQARHMITSARRTLEKLEVSPIFRTSRSCIWRSSCSVFLARL